MAPPSSRHLRVVDGATGATTAAAPSTPLTFDAVFRLHARFVAGVALRVLGRTREVEDLVQDVFLTAMERLPSLRDPGAFGAWLAAMARNRAVDYFRRAPKKTTELMDDMAIAEPDRGEARAILAIIRSLPEAYRETLMLRLVEGMTGPEIAAATGLTEGSVRVNLHRGMRQLRERLERRSL